MSTAEARAGFVLASDGLVNVPCNTSDDELFDNVRTNSWRDLPWVEPREANDIPLVICGGGPSLKDCLPEIRERYRLGQHVFAINGAAEFLNNLGVRPLCFLTIDARPENVKFVQSRPAQYYLLSSTVAPELIDELEGENVALFHPDIEGIVDCIPYEKSGTLVSASLTSGLTALSVAHTLGYREIHCYGYDSSDAESSHHAYPQDETAMEKERLRIIVAGKEFSTQPTMYRQAMEFPKLAEALSEQGSAIFVHGDGLLPTYVRELTKPADASKACYDLGAAPASFDFIAWLVTAEMARVRDKAKGPLRVAFKPGPANGFRNDWGREFVIDRQQAMQHVLRPALAFVHAVEDNDALDGGVWHNRYTFSPIVEAARKGERVPEFHAPAKVFYECAEWITANEAKQCVTITLRESHHWPHRNSNLPAWLEFAVFLNAGGLNVVFVRDTAKADEELDGHLICPRASQDIQFRMALYQQALCNLFVANGPAGLAFFSSRPWLMFSPLDETGKWPPGTDAWWKKNHGIGNGEQWPWSKPNQKIIWELDTYGAIRSAWDGLKLS